jgi:hypothetical protein
MEATPVQVYLAGPMRGLPLFNFPAFHEATRRLRNAGISVASPAEHDEEGGFDPAGDDVDFDLQAAMVWDLGCVLECDAVVLLPGWPNSKGCRLEIAVARGTGKGILHYTQWDDDDEGFDLITDASGSLLVNTVLYPPESILHEADRLVSGDRQASYGHPLEDFSRTGRLWGAILGTEPIEPRLVGLMMVCLKVSREVHGHKRDNLVDLAGYAKTVELCGE